MEPASAKVETPDQPQVVLPPPRKKRRKLRIVPAVVAPAPAAVIPADAEAQCAAVQADEQAPELSEQLYKSSLVDFMHVLDSERSLYAAQDALVQSDQGISLNLAQLYKALGGGWEMEAGFVSAAFQTQNH